MPGVACFMDCVTTKRLRRAIEEAPSPGLWHAHRLRRPRRKCFPNPDTYCEIDPTSSISGASPLCASTSSGRIRVAPGQDMQETFRAIVETMGGEYRTKTSIHGQYPFGIEEGGKIIHEVGTARMGTDPKTSC